MRAYLPALLLFPTLLILALLPGSARAQPIPALVSVCFTPGEACGARITAAIEHARAEVRVQAYGFSAPPILQALAEARERGVDVAVILDKSDARRLCDRQSDLLAAGVKMWIDHMPGIAHNKVIVIDRHLVIGGSYNFTSSAERRNAENVTMIDSEPIAALFLANWQSRQAASIIAGASCS